MDSKFIQSVLQSNGAASIPQVPHGNESDQSYLAPSSSSSSIYRGMSKPGDASQAAKRGSNNCDAPAEVLQCDGEDLGTTKSPPHINTISQDMRSHVAQVEVDQRKKAPPSLCIDSRPIPSSAPSEPVEPPLVLPTTNQADDNDPIYSAGEMKIFDQRQKAIPKLHEARWQVISPYIFDRVHERLGRGRFAVRIKTPKAPPLIELMSAGVTKALSKPAVVVVLPRYINKMQKFLDTDSTVQCRCKPQDGTTVELLALACRGSSILAGMPGGSLQNNVEYPSDDDSDYSDDTSLHSTDDTDSGTGLSSMAGLVEVDVQAVSVVREPSNVDGDKKHGMAIRLITKDGSRSVHGTCGGLLRLITPEQPPRQVGLMAGHLLEQLCQGSGKENDNTTDSSLVIGNILYPKSLADIPRYDWALFDAAELGFEHEMANQDSYAVVQESEIPEVNSVVVIRTSRGDMTGTLSSSTTGIMLNPDQGFVNVRTIILDRGSSITKGDSGAWVFQEGYEKIYGYIIATNGNGHAYMVLLHAAMAEVQTSLGAASVSLAISTDRAFSSSDNSHHHISREDVGIASVIPSGISLMSEFSQVDDDMESWQFLDADSSGNAAGSLQELAGSLGLDTSPTSVSQGSWGVVGNAVTDRSSIMDRHTSTFDRQQKDPLQTREIIRIILDKFQRREKAPKADPNNEKPGEITSVIRMLEISLQENHRRLSWQNKLGKKHLEDGRVPEAIEILERVVEGRKSFLGANHPDCLASQHELAVAYVQNGQTKDAVRLLKHVVEIEEEVLGISLVGRVTSQHELGRAYLADGQASEAIEILEHVVAVKMSTLDDSNPDLLASEIVLAEADLSAGQASDAVDLLEHVVATATGTSSEHEQIRAHSVQWLNLARSRRDGLNFERLAGKDSKPLSIFIGPRK